jgi:hypothetical protein
MPRVVALGGLGDDDAELVWVPPDAVQEGCLLLEKPRAVSNEGFNPQPLTRSPNSASRSSVERARSTSSVTPAGASSSSCCLASTFAIITKSSSVVKPRTYGAWSNKGRYKLTVSIHHTPSSAIGFNHFRKQINIILNPFLNSPTLPSQPLLTPTHPVVPTNPSPHTFWDLLAEVAIRNTLSRTDTKMCRMRACRFWSRYVLTRWVS